MKKRRIAALAAAASLALAGCGSQAATSNDGNSSGTQQTQPDGQQPAGMDFSALATKLGVSVEKLQAAMQKNRPQQGEQPSAGSPDDMATNLAQELGLDESKVKAALEDFMPQGGPPNGQAPPSGQAPNGAATPSGTTSSS